MILLRRSCHKLCFDFCTVCKRLLCSFDKVAREDWRRASPFWEVESLAPGRERRLDLSADNKVLYTFHPEEVGLMFEMKDVSSAIQKSLLFSSPFVVLFIFSVPRLGPVVFVRNSSWPIYLLSRRFFAIYWLVYQKTDGQRESCFWKQMPARLRSCFKKKWSKLLSILRGTCLVPVKPALVLRNLRFQARGHLGKHKKLLHTALTDQTTGCPRFNTQN